MKKMNIKSNSSHPTTEYVLCGMSGFLLLTTIISGVVLSSSTTHADTTTTRGSTVSVTVNNACTMKGGSDGTKEGDSTFSATIEPGRTITINGSKLTTVCNDLNGYSVYAIGYSGNSYEAPNNTKMLSTGLGTDIVTATSGDQSYWSMKLSPVTGVTPPTFMNNFDSDHVIPSTYTQIAEHRSSTSTATSAGAAMQVSYTVHADSAQIADTYTGKVKYTMIHPYNEIAPTTPMTLDTIAADTSRTHYLQDSIDCYNSTVNTKVTLTDSRDGQTYQVAKAADGQCWMLENLKLGKTLTEGQALTLTNINSNTNGIYTLQYSDIPTDGKFHDYTVDDIPNQNNSNEWICRTDWDSCYYNWYTATAGAGTTATTSGSVDTSICPAGWSLPIGGGSGQFQALYNQYPSAAQMEVDNPTETKNNSAGKIPGFLLSGGYYTGGAGNLGSDGRYWSRTASSAQYAYDLRIYTSSVGSTDHSYKCNGFAVRCILQ